MHEMWMKRALSLAEQGWGATNPNPLVGAVVVNNGMLVGEGYHRAYGQAHAEVEALLQAGDRARDATLYVSLEPCSHHGKTPPCTDAIIKAGIKEVYAALLDPNPKVAGSGFSKLQEAGIKTHVGLMQREAEEMNEIFIHFITTGLPYVIHKTAMSLDGKTASSSGHSQWITGEKARHHVHWMRQRVASIMVGVGTVIYDNPSLTVRGIIEPLHPLRIIVDSQGRIPIKSKVLNCPLLINTVIATTEHMSKEKERAIVDRGAEVLRLESHHEKVSLKALITELGNRKIDSVILEGGGKVAATAYESKLVDKIMYYIAPKLIGGADTTGVIMGSGIQSMDDAIMLENMKFSHIGNDVLVTALVKK